MESYTRTLIRLPQGRPRVLVTNDDGIGSPGLLELKQALEAVGEVFVVAPETDRTGAARSITMRAPLWVEEVALGDGSTGYATDGTPVDCVRLAALGLLDRPPDVIVSGVNLSGNLGDDITYSGTVAAAFEGIMLDTPAIAISAEGFHEHYDLSIPALIAARLVALMVESGFPAKTLLNVNCPDRPWTSLAGARLTTLGKRIYGDKVQLQETAGRRRRYFIYGDDLSYHQERGSDFEAVADGFVSITPIHFELTAREALASLADWQVEALLVPRTGSRAAAPGEPPMAAGVAAAIRAGAAADGPHTGPAPSGSGGAPALSGPGTAPAPAGPAGTSAPLEPLSPVVLFDLDGTVVDSVELIVNSFAHAVRHVLGSELTREELIANVGRPLREQMALFSEGRADDLVLAYREYNHREHDRLLTLYPGMEPLLEALRGQGRQLGLVTSKSRPTTEMAFHTTGIEPLFAVTVCVEDTARHKPFPDPLLYAVKQLGVPPSEAVYVGDSPYDLRAARAAGMRSVAVSWGVFPLEVLRLEQPDRVAQSMEELARILGCAPEGPDA